MTVVTKAEYARSKGWSRGAVAEFVKAGKVVLTSAGKVNVEASDKRLAELRDPTKDGVRERHAFERGQKAAGVAPTTSLEIEPGDTLYVIRQKANAKADMHRAALLAIERDEKEGKLGDVETMRRTAFDAGRTAMNAIFNLPHRLDPLLAGEPDAHRRSELWDRELRALCEDIRKACGGG